MTANDKGVDVLRAIRVAEAYCRDAGATEAANNAKEARAAFSVLLEAAKKSQMLLATPDLIEPRHRQELCEAIGRCTIPADPRIARVQHTEADFEARR